MKLNRATAVGKDLTLLLVKAVNLYFCHHHSHIPNAKDVFPVTCELCLEEMYFERIRQV